MPTKSCPNEDGKSTCDDRRTDCISRATFSRKRPRLRPYSMAFVALVFISWSSSSLVVKAQNKVSGTASRHFLLLLINCHNYSNSLPTATASFFKTNKKDLFFMINTWLFFIQPCSNSCNIQHFTVLLFARICKNKTLDSVVVF